MNRQARHRSRKLLLAVEKFIADNKTAGTLTSISASDPIYTQIKLMRRFLGLVDVTATTTPSTATFPTTSRYPNP